MVYLLSLQIAETTAKLISNRLQYDGKEVLVD